MKLLPILFCFLFTTSISAQIYGVDWAIVAQDTLMSSRHHRVLGQESDDQGNVYVFGNFTFRADMDRSINSEIIAANSHQGNFFIAKYDPQGNIIWAKDFGGSSSLDIKGIDIDNSGNLYLTGWFLGLFHYDSDIHGAHLKSVYNGSWTTNGFVLKYNSSGQFEWINHLEGNPRILPEDIEVSSQGKIIVTGNFEGQAFFNNSTSFDTITSNGLKDVFLTQYDQNGDYEWAISFGGVKNDKGIRIASDNLNNIYIISELEDTVDLDPSANTYEVIQGTPFQQAYGELFGANTIAKYDSTGSFVWGHLFQDIGGFIRMQDIDVNSLNQIGVTGVYSNGQTQSFDFDPGTGTAFINGTNSQSSYVALYDSSLVFLWTEDVGLPYYQASELAFNSNNDIYVVGQIRTLFSTHKNGFISKCGADGGLLFSNVIEAKNEVYNLNVSINGVDEPVISGQYNDTIDLDPSSNTYYIRTPNNPPNIILSFLANYSVNGVFQYGFPMSYNDYYSGGSLEMDDFATFIETDFEGNIFARGLVVGSGVDFDPSSNSEILGSDPPHNAKTFIVKYDSLSNYQWGFTLDSIENRGRITADNSGNCYITATNIGTTDLDPSMGTALFTTQNLSTGLVAKYDPLGNYLWAFQLENLSNFSRSNAEDIVVDSSGNVLISGSYIGDIDFDPSPSQFILSNPLVGDWWLTKQKTFLAKYDPNGNLIWAVDFGGMRSEVMSLAVNSNDDIFITGTFDQNIDIDPSSASYILNATAIKNILLVKYDGSANLQWGFALGNTGTNWGVAVAAGANHVYLTGAFSGTCDMDPGPGVVNLTRVGNGTSTFVARFDASNGALDWVFDLKGARSEPRGMDINANENIVVTGVLKNDWFLSEFPTVMDVDPSPNTVGLVSTHAPFSDVSGMFTVVYDSLGSLQWAMDMHESTLEFYSNPLIDYNLARYDKSGNIIVSGGLLYDGDFAPREAEYVLETRNGSEFFLAKYRACISTYSTESVTECGNYDWRGDNYTLSGTYYDTLSNHVGCDSVVSIALTILPIDIMLESVIACDSFTWTNGVNYTSSGTYYNYLTNSSGCDSTLTLNLTIPSQDTIQETVTACDSFTWTNGTNYTSSGIYYRDLTSSAGCDSIEALNLTIRIIDTTITVLNDSTLFANEIGANYQWFDCQTSQLLPGEVNQSFDTQASGSYAVILETGICKDTSACYNINMTNNIEEFKLSEISVYPNPASGELNIEFGEKLNTVNVQFLDANGRTLFTNEYLQTSVINLNFDYASGIYLLIINSGGERVQRTIVIKNQ